MGLMCLNDEQREYVSKCKYTNIDLTLSEDQLRSKIKKVLEFWSMGEMFKYNFDKIYLHKANTDDFKEIRTQINWVLNETGDDVYILTDVLRLYTVFSFHDFKISLIKAYFIWRYIGDHNKCSEWMIMPDEEEMIWIQVLNDFIFVSPDSYSYYNVEVKK